MASVSHARGFDETEFNAVLENCLRDFPQVKVLRKVINKHPAAVSIFPQ